MADTTTAYPLRGKRVLVTRAREQASAFARLLSERGGVPIEFATIQTEPPSDWDPVDRAIANLDGYAWAIFTSANGVRYFRERLEQHGLSPRALDRVRLAAIGPATASALRSLDLPVEYSPAEYVAEAVVEGMKQFDLAGRRVLLPRAQDVREVLAEGLIEQGAIVDDVAVYQTRPAGDPDLARRLFEEGAIDLVTFTSSSTVRNLVGALGADAPKLLATVVVASIGPITSQTARELGLTVQVEASEHTIPGLVAALEAALGHAK